MFKIIISSIILFTASPIDPPNAEQLFEVAHSEFKESFASEKLKIYLDDLIENRETDAKILTELKAMRKKGSVLRNAYNLFHQTHEAPEALALFDDRFGDLNDALAAHLPDLIAYRANLLKESLPFPELPFSPCTTASFEEYTSHLFSQLEQLLSLNELRAEQFHEIRWTMKKFLNLLYLEEQLESNPDRKATYDTLYQLNQEMGTIHDQVVLADLQDELIYEEQILPLPPHIKNEILNFIRN